MAEIPSANGHGTAKSLATLYGILSNGCSRNGVSIMSDASLKYAITPHSQGPRFCALWSTNKNLGWVMSWRKELLLVGNISPSFNNKMFGHAGVGGAVAFGDPDKGLGYGFICNQQHNPKDLYRTSNLLTEKLYSIIS